MLCASLSASAYDFEVDGVAYTITSVTDLTVTVDGLVNKELAVVNIPEEVQYKNKTLKVIGIEPNAFEYNEVIREVSLPNTITFIGDRAFRYSALEKINIPQSLTEIGIGAFCYSSISTFNIPEGVDKINSNVFEGCVYLTEVKLPSTLQSIGTFAFGRSGLQKIIIPESVKTLGRWAFANTQLTSIRLPEGIETIPEYCFYSCDKLSDVKFSSSTIKEDAFYKCTALQHIELPEKLTTIGEYAFKGCENLIEFSIPSKVKSIKPSIIWDCPNITKLTIGKSLDGLPFTFREVNGDRDAIRTLGSYYGSYSVVGGPKLVVYLQGVKRFIIEDADNEFSIKGFQMDGGFRPPFAKTELDYYYVGRPLVDIKEWSLEETDCYIKKFDQGTGRIKKLEIGGGCASVPFFYQNVDSLILNNKVKEFIGSNIYSDGLKMIECRSTTPPTLCQRESGGPSDNSFPAKVYTDVTLYVPYGCKEIYSNAPGWRCFWDIQELDESAGVEAVEILSTDTLNVYSIQGNLVKSGVRLYELQDLPKGVYIVVSPKCTKKIKI